MEEMKRKAERQQKMRPMNQWKLFLQKNLNNIAMDLLAVDSEREYSVDIKDFMRVIDRRSKIPQYLKESDNTELLHEFIGGYMDNDTGRVDYRGLVEELRYFNYEEANNQKDFGGESTKLSFSKTPGETRKRKTIFEDDYIVLDSQKVPNNVLENIESRLSRVTRYLKRHFGNEKALEKAIREQLVE